MLVDLEECDVPGYLEMLLQNSLDPRLNDISTKVRLSRHVILINQIWSILIKVFQSVFAVNGNKDRKNPVLRISFETMKGRRIFVFF